MRRPLLAFAAAAALAATAAGAAPAQTFTIVSSSPGGLPSFEEPNQAGAITVPRALSTPPSAPQVLSYEQLLDLWQRAGAAYGVPWQVLAAINKIESNFGQNMGPSSAGAVGWMQFLPSTWTRWGTDADGDGLADPWNPEDAVYSAARYLAAAGAHEDLARAVFAYNHAQWYVDDVLETARLFEDGAALSGLGAFGPGGLFQPDALEQRLSDARRAVTEAQRAIHPLERNIEELGWEELALVQRAGDPDLPEEKFAALDARIARVAAEEDAVREELDRRRRELDEAVAALETLRAEEAAGPASAPFGGPLASGEYVFPVGGGPDAVSVAHDHHDYPAADIAAPEGSPLYALANATVVESYPRPEGKCGIGLKLRLDSGAVYVYCHLAYLEPAVVPGAALAAGAPVGLVGSTGNSTGPHLHLALDPALAYPQEEPWFQSLAGQAFSWQDAPTPAGGPAPPVRVFRVESSPAPASAPRVVTFTR